MRKVLFVSMLLLATTASVWAKEGRGYLGVTVRNIEVLAAGEVERGLLIDSVFAGSGAKQAGLAEEDKIVALDGVTILGMGDLDTALESTHPGQEVEVSVERGGAVETHVVTLGAAPVRLKEDMAFGRYVVALDRTPRMGIEIETLNPQLAGFFGVDEGVLIKRVHEGHAAFSAGLSAGDIVLEVDGAAVRDKDDVLAALRGRSAGDVLDVTVQRHGRIEVYTVVLEEGSADKQVPLKVRLSLGTGNEIQADNIVVDLAPFGEVADEAVRLGGNNMTFDFDTNTIRAEDAKFFTTRDRSEELRSRIQKLQEELEKLQRELAQREDQD